MNKTTSKPSVPLNFDRLVGKGPTRVRVGENCWAPLYDEARDAEFLGVDICDYVRQTMLGVDAGSKPIERTEFFFPAITVVLSLWPEEHGIVIFHESELIGLAIGNPADLIIMPVKPWSHTMRSESGSRFVLYNDGTAFCRTSKNDHLKPAASLVFADVETAASVYLRGGKLKVTRTPTKGLAPVYIPPPAPTVGSDGFITLEPNSFQRSTPLAEIYAVPVA